MHKMRARNAKGELMKNKIWIIGLLLGFVALTTQATVTVTNLVVEQHPGTKLMKVSYDVHSTDANLVSISLVVSNGAEQVSAPTVTGDVGSDVEIGTDREFIWNAGADWNGNVATLDYTIIADDGINLIVPSGMVLIPGGTNEGVDPEHGAYSLTVSSFCMDETEVTKNFWDYVYNWAIENDYEFDHAGAGKDSDHPVQTIDWYDCIKWCNARSEMEGRTPCYLHIDQMSIFQSGLQYGQCNTNANGYRLPTTEEWEYAACGGLISQRFPWGNTISWSNANYWASSDWLDYDLISQTGMAGPPLDYAAGDLPYTSPVRSFSANGYGLYDMVGNVSEWCGTSEFESYQRIRGGSYNGDASHEARVHYLQPLKRSVSYADNNCGFRAICR